MNQLKKLGPLVQLLPAVVVAAVVFVTLPATQPVLAEVPERLTPAASSEAPEPEAEPEEDSLPALPYADGVYTGSSRGYGGQVKVQVTMENGYITDLEILDASHETSAFLKRARRLLPAMLEAQTWEVDAVSEATYTSRGILGAVKNALTGEEVINPLPPKKAPPAPLVEEIFEAPAAYRDGIYTASAQGYGGLITMAVTISGGEVTDISVVDASGESSSYLYKARHVIPAILEAGSPEVDAVSGATYSSTGIINAVKAALKQASNETVPEEETAEETTAEEAPAESIPEEPSAPAEEPAASAEPAEEPESSGEITEWSEFFEEAGNIWKDAQASMEQAWEQVKQWGETLG